MTSPITPNPSIHNLPPAVAQQQLALQSQQLQAMGKQLVQALINAILDVLTGGVYGTVAGTNSQSALTLFGNLFTNLFSLLGVTSPGATLAGTAPASFNAPAVLTTWINDLIAPLNLLVPNSSWQALIDGVVGGSGNSITDLINQLIYGTLTVDPARLPMIPISAIGNGNPTPNLILNGAFNGANSLNGSTDWTWDSGVDNTGTAGSGSAKAVADGSTKLLVSNGIAVTQGQTLDIGGYVQWSGLTSTGSPLWIGVKTYLNGASVGSTNLAAVASPGASGSWTHLTNTYTVPAGVDTVYVTLNVDATATAGSVWYDDLTATKTGLMSGSWMTGITGNSVAQDLQDMVDHIYNAVNGTSTTGNALSTVFDSLTTHTNNIQDIVDNVVQALSGGSSTNNPITHVKSNLLQIPAGNIVGTISGTSVTYDATGAGAVQSGSVSNSISTSWSHTIGASANYVIVGIFCGADNNSYTTRTRSVTYGGVAMSSLGARDDNGSLQHIGFVEFFGLANPPSGLQTVSVTVSGSGQTFYALTGNSLSYVGWASTGSLNTAGATSNSSPSMTVSSTTSGQIVVNCIGCTAGYTSSETLSAYSQTSRYNSGTMAPSGWQFSTSGAFILGDASGGSSITFSATSSTVNSNDQWASLAVVLSP